MNGSEKRDPNWLIDLRSCKRGRSIAPRPIDGQRDRWRSLSEEEQLAISKDMEVVRLRAQLYATERALEEIAFKIPEQFDLPTEFTESVRRRYVEYWEQKYYYDRVVRPETVM